MWPSLNGCEVENFKPGWRLVARRKATPAQIDQPPTAPEVELLTMPLKIAVR